MLLALPVFAETAEEKGLRISTEVEARDTGWKDEQMNMKMILTNRHGEESGRDVMLKMLEVKGDGDKSISVFRSPRDIKGTALLSHSHKVGSDDQWLYLPALKRVKRISSKNKSGSFMGSEFAYEDISSQEVEKYQHKFLKDDVIDGKKTYLIERIPVDKYSGYSKQHVWIDSERYIPLKLEFFDRKGQLLKTLTFSGYTKYLDNYWRAAEQEMVNHQSGKKTKLVWSERTFNNGFKSSDFIQNALKRIR
jgi:outer membrane lipoprotein-sorting protein